MKVDYSRENLLTLDPTSFRAMIRERAHHTVEIQVYEAIAKGKSLPADQGNRVRELLSTWNERGLQTDGPDLIWVNTLLDMADRVARGETVDLSGYATEPFDEAARKAAYRLILERRSVRHWTDEEVPDSMIDDILRAGLMAAHGCNLCSLRFVVVREKNEPGMFRGSDIPGGPVHILACQDRRVYYVQPGYVAKPKTLENNRVLDCGAAMQNMVLMAHALGLGGCWLTFTSDEMRDRVRQRFDLPEYIELVTYFDVGFPAQTPMAPGRMSLDEVILARS